MAQYLVDSNVVINYLHNRPATVALIKELINRGDELHVSAMSVAEVMAGAYPKERSIIKKFLRSLTLEMIDFAIGEQAGTYYFDLKRKGFTTPLTDLTIAATAKVRDLTLITYNRKHYPMKDIVLYPVILL